jgi:hypothetical protein
MAATMAGRLLAEVKLLPMNSILTALLSRLADIAPRPATANRMAVSDSSKAFFVNDVALDRRPRFQSPPDPL